MDYNLIKHVLIVFIIFTLGVYMLWIKVFWTGIPRAYDYFMQLLIKHKDILEKDCFYLTIEDDYQNRRVPEFNSDDFRILISQNDKLKEADKNDILNSFDKFDRTLEAEIIDAARRGASKLHILNKYKRIGRYPSIPKKVHIYALSLLLRFYVSTL